MFSSLKGIPLTWILLCFYLDSVIGINITDVYLTAWENWSKCNVSCGQGHQTRSRTCPDIEFNDNCSLSIPEIRICHNGHCNGKTNLSRSRKGDKHDDTTGLDNAVNSAVYSSVIFVPGIIGFIFVCIRTHRKTKMEEKRLQDLERRKLFLRDDEFI